LNINTLQIIVPCPSKMVQQVKDLDELKALFTSAGDKLVVIDFYATWCGPCKMVAPKIVAMADELTEKCVFLKVDVDEADDVSEEYNIQVRRWDRKT
jgi:thioredoxin 1